MKNTTKNAIGLIADKYKLKQFLPDKTYKNIYGEENLSIKEVEDTIKTLRDIRLEGTGEYKFEDRLLAQVALENIRKHIYANKNMHMIKFYVFAKAIYMKMIDNYTHYDINGITIVKILLCATPSIQSKWNFDDIYFVLKGDKVIGAFYENMKERRVLTSIKGDKIYLPVIRNKEMKNDIISAITLMKVGGK